jgi:hypothetical protein
MLYILLLVKLIVIALYLQVLTLSLSVRSLPQLLQ